MIRKICLNLKLNMKETKTNRCVSRVRALRVPIRASFVFPFRARKQINYTNDLVYKGAISSE